MGSRKRPSQGNYEKEKEHCITLFDQWSEADQVEFVERLISRMCHYQHGHINSYLKPMLQRDFITALPGKKTPINATVVTLFTVLKHPSLFVLLFPFLAQGLDHIAENILSFLDARSLCSAELVCKEWQRVISEGMLWKKLIERMVRTDPLWKGLSERHQWWVKSHFHPRNGATEEEWILTCTTGVLVFFPGRNISSRTAQQKSHPTRTITHYIPRLFKT